MGKIADFAEKKISTIWGTIREVKETDVQHKMQNVLRGDFLSTNIISGNTNLFLLWVGMAIFYVGMRYYVEDDIKQIARLQKELKEVHLESVTRSSELMKASKRSSVVKAVKEKGLGLSESTQPPMLIE